jgi:hypothetical protein
MGYLMMINIHTRTHAQNTHIHTHTRVCSLLQSLLLSGSVPASVTALTQTILPTGEWRPLGGTGCKSPALHHHQTTKCPHRLWPMRLMLPWQPRKVFELEMHLMKRS